MRGDKVFMWAGVKRGGGVRRSPTGQASGGHLTLSAQRGFDSWRPGRKGQRNGMQETTGKGKLGSKSGKEKSKR